MELRFIHLTRRNFYGGQIATSQTVWQTSETGRLGMQRLNDLSLTVHPVTQTCANYACRLPTSVSSPVSYGKRMVWKTTSRRQGRSERRRSRRVALTRWPQLSHCVHTRIRNGFIASMLHDGGGAESSPVYVPLARHWRPF